GQHEDREIRLDFEGLRDEVYSAGSGHADVAQHQRDLVAPEMVERLLARRSGIGLELLLRQELLERVADRLLVVHYQHRGASGRFSQRGLLAGRAKDRLL